MAKKLDINSNQNKRENLRYLFCKQVYYDKASNCFFVSFLVSLTVLILVAIYSVCKNLIADGWLTFIEIFIPILSLCAYFLNFLTIKFSKTGADFLDLFDSEVFEISRVSKTSKDELISIADHYVKKNEELFNARCSDEGNQGIKYKNWYEGVKDDVKQKMILRCQLSCMDWSIPIFIATLVIISLFMIIYLIIIISLFFDDELNKFIVFIAVNSMNYINFIVYLRWTIQKVRFCRETKKEIHSLLDEPGKNSSKTVEEKIYEFRKIPTVAFRFVYFIVYKLKHVNDVE